MLTVSRRSLPLLLVVACVVASIALSDTASARTWLAGGHATPEQLARHQLYVSLGLHDHHGHVDVEPADGTASGVSVVGAAPAWSVAVPANVADPGQVARDARDAGLSVSPQLTTLMRVQVANRLQPTSPVFLVLDPPPRFAA